MAKVVGRDERAVARVTCRGCASIVEYVENEVVHSYTTDYAGGNDAYDYIHCPSCNKKVEV